MTTLGPGDSQLLKAIVTLGVPSAIALFLVYWITLEQGKRITEVQMLLSQHEYSRQRDMQQMNAFLYAICLNTADTDNELARCAIVIDGHLEQRPPAK